MVAKSAKKQQIFFRLTACMCRCNERRIFSFQTTRLTVKAELELTFYEFCLDVVLHIYVEMPIDMGAVADISGIMGKYLVHSFWVTLMRL